MKSSSPYTWQKIVYRTPLFRALPSVPNSRAHNRNGYIASQTQTGSTSSTLYLKTNRGLWKGITLQPFAQPRVDAVVWIMSARRKNRTSSPATLSQHKDILTRQKGNQGQTGEYRSAAVSQRRGAHGTGSKINVGLRVHWGSRPMSEGARAELGARSRRPKKKKKRLSWVLVRCTLPEAPFCQSWRCVYCNLLGGSKVTSLRVRSQPLAWWGTSLFRYWYV